METVNGYVEHIIFQNNDNGYTVMNLVSDGDEIICVGTCKGLGQGENIAAQGEYVEHPSYGMQFKVSSYRIVMPEDSAGMERYLGSGAVKGVGPALASRIVKRFGDDTFRIIEEEPQSQGNRGSDGRKKRSSGCGCLFAEIWHFQYACSQDIRCLRYGAVRYYEGKSVPSGGRYQWCGI